MEESNNQKSPIDIFETRPSPMPEEVPFDLSSSANTIPPAQKPKETTLSWSSHCVNKKSPSDYADRVEKYTSYFKEGEIFPIPELVEAVEPKALSFGVTDLKTKRQAGIKKETFEDLLKIANIPGSIFAVEALLPGMFCFLRRKLRNGWPVVISPHASSGYNRNIEARDVSRSPYAMFQCN